MMRFFFFQNTEALAGVRGLLGLGVFGLGWPLWSRLGWHAGG